MPILRLNAGPEGLVLHSSPACALRVLKSAALGSGPVIVMIHGFKYGPNCIRHSPHTSIFAAKSLPVARNTVPWLHPMGFGAGDADEGLAVAFGWKARGTLWQAQDKARAAGQHLADVIKTIHSRAPHRPIHVVAHSLGSEVIFEALHSLPAHSVNRIVILMGASYTSRAVTAMQQTKAGRNAELFNVTSRENDPFDFFYERFIQPPVRGDQAIGRGIRLPNALTLQLDCSRTLALLAQFGGHISEPTRRVCHWSGYSRPGALPFYARAMRAPAAVPLCALQLMLPATVEKRWSRMFAKPRSGANTDCGAKARIAPLRSSVSVRYKAFAQTKKTMAHHS